MIWIVLGLLTICAMIIVLKPFLRFPENNHAQGQHRDTFYREQLQDLDHELKIGLISTSEVEAARFEIGRRFLNAKEEEKAAPVAPRHKSLLLPLMLSILVPALALSLYTFSGSPFLPGQPLVARQEDRGKEADIVAAVTRLEQHLATNPEDRESLEVLAPVYMKMARFEEAADTYRRLLALSGSAPAVEEALGEALFRAEGMTAEAEAAFNRALAADPSLVKARFYRALAHAKAGRFKEAADDYDEILRRSPGDAPWIVDVQRGRAAALSALAAAESKTMQQAVQAAATMTDEERRDMISGMVDRLAARLAQTPRDSQGWQRLIQAYAVLGRLEEARAALKTALLTFTDDPTVQGAIRESAQALGVDAE